MDTDDEEESNSNKRVLVVGGFPSDVRLLVAIGGIIDSAIAGFDKQDRIDQSHRFDNIPSCEAVELKLQSQKPVFTEVPRRYEKRMREHKVHKTHRSMKGNRKS